MTDWIEVATKHGAKFAVRPDGKYEAYATKRGRPVPLFAIVGETQVNAAHRFCQYIGVQGAGKLGDGKEVM